MYHVYPEASTYSKVMFPCRCEQQGFCCSAKMLEHSVSKASSIRKVRQCLSTLEKMKEPQIRTASRPLDNTYYKGRGPWVFLSSSGQPLLGDTWIWRTLHSDHFWLRADKIRINCVWGNKTLGITLEHRWPGGICGVEDWWRLILTSPVLYYRKVKIPFIDHWRSPQHKELNLRVSALGKLRLTDLENMYSLLQCFLSFKLTYKVLDIINFKHSVL